MYTYYNLHLEMRRRPIFLYFANTLRANMNGGECKVVWMNVALLPSKADYFSEKGTFIKIPKTNDDSNLSDLAWSFEHATPRLSKRYFASPPPPNITTL